MTAKYPLPPKNGRFYEENLFKLIVDSQLIIEGRSSISDRRKNLSKNLNYTRYLFHQVCHH